MRRWRKRKVDGRGIIGEGGGGDGEAKEKKETGRCERMSKGREKGKRKIYTKEKVKEKIFRSSAAHCEKLR